MQLTVLFGEVLETSRVEPLLEEVGHERQATNSYICSSHFLVLCLLDHKLQPPNRSPEHRRPTDRVLNPCKPNPDKSSPQSSPRYISLSGVLIVAIQNHCDHQEAFQLVTVVVDIPFRRYNAAVIE